MCRVSPQQYSPHSRPEFTGSSHASHHTLHLHEATPWVMAFTSHLHIYVCFRSCAACCILASPMLVSA